MDYTHVMYVCNDCKNRTVIAPRSLGGEEVGRFAEVSIFDVSWICPDCAEKRVQAQIQEAASQQMNATEEVPEAEPYTAEPIEPVAPIE